MPVRPRVEDQANSTAVARSSPRTRTRRTSLSWQSQCRSRFSQLDPMISTAVVELEQAGVSERPKVALADVQYWNEQQFDEVIANKHIQVVIPPDSGGATSPRRGWIGGRYSWMRAVLDSAHGKELYRRRIQMIEPVFAHTKHNRLIRSGRPRSRSRGPVAAEAIEGKSGRGAKDWCCSTSGRPRGSGQRSARLVAGGPWS